MEVPYLILIFSFQSPKFDIKNEKFTSQIIWLHIFKIFLTLVWELLELYLMRHFKKNFSGVDEKNLNFIHTRKKFLCEKFISMRLVIKMFWKCVSRQFERRTLRFRYQIWRFALKKLKLDRYTPCSRTPKNNFKA